MLPIDFEDGRLTVDLGRKVGLGTLAIKIIQGGAADDQILNLSLSISNSKNLDQAENLTLCSFGSYENDTYWFSCSGQLGQHLLMTAADNGTHQLEDIIFLEEINSETFVKLTWFRG